MRSQRLERSALDSLGTPFDTGAPGRDQRWGSAGFPGSIGLRTISRDPDLTAPLLRLPLLVLLVDAGVWMVFGQFVECIGRGVGFWRLRSQP